MICRAQWASCQCYVSPAFANLRVPEIKKRISKPHQKDTKLPSAVSGDEAIEKMEQKEAAKLAEENAKCGLRKQVMKSLDFAVQRWTLGFQLQYKLDEDCRHLATIVTTLNCQQFEVDPLHEGKLVCKT